jgi:hypothetical protein
MRHLMAVPQVRPHDLSGLSMQAAVTRIGNYYTGLQGDQRSPDLEAIEFYTYSHMVAVIRAKFGTDVPLPTWASDVVARYVTIVATQSQRMYAYLMMIVTREARHAAGGPTVQENLKTLGHSAEIREFLTNLPADEITSATTICSSWVVGASLRAYVCALIDAFETDAWSEGYGGKAWAAVAKCLLDMLEGRSSLELMLDSAYSLAHNNGPIFNKGMLYTKYSDRFQRVLDIQRSGQMPEALIGGEFDSILSMNLKTKQQELSEHLRPDLDRLGAEFPDAFGPAVDWHKVVELGALGSYGEEIQKSPKVVKFNGFPAEHVGDLYVMPGQKVAVFKRKVA